MKKIQESAQGGAKSLAPRASLHGWVQTERAAHEAWGRLAIEKPRASALLHVLVAHMNNRNAVVVNQRTLARMMGCSVRTVQYAISDLVAGRWIQVVKLNGPGTVSAYVINARVAWSQASDKKHSLAIFSAAIIADFEDQDPALLGSGDLRRIPVLYPGEQQLPAGDGEPPPSQPFLDGLEPDLPALEGEGD